MGELPDFDLLTFSRELRVVSPPARALPDEALRRLHIHYRELRLWNRRLALIGPGTEADVLQRHYAESLAAAVALRGVKDRKGDPSGQILVDIGSGAGFPGWVLAAAHPELRVFLVEARQRKWAFLQSAARKAALPIRCLNARVDLPLPTGLPPVFDWVTTRALRLPAPVLKALAERIRPGGGFLFWQGGDDPVLPSELRPTAEWPLPGSQRRRILQVTRTAAGGVDQQP